MKLLKRLLLMAGVAAISALPMKVDAATLTITDTFGGSTTVWTLDVETECTTCTVSLTADFQGATNAYDGSYLDSVQWTISDPNVDPTAVDLTATTAGTTADWDFFLDQNLSANQCGGGAADAVCGEWISGGTGDGYLIDAPVLLSWTFEVTFASALPATLTTGTIRAAFNNSNGTNFNIFSPGDHTFDDGGGEEGGGTDEEGGGAPEPGTLALLGLGLAATAAKVRRRVATAVN